MIQVPGEFLIDAARGKLQPMLQAEIGPYDREDPSNPDIPLPYRDLPGIEFTKTDPTDPDLTEDRYVYVHSELTDRIISLGNITHRMALEQETPAASELSLDLDNSDGMLSQFLGGSAQFHQAHQWMMKDRHIGRILRVRGGARDSEGAYHSIPLYEGIIDDGLQIGGAINLKCLDLLERLQSVTITGNHTYTDKTPPYIIEDLYDTYVTEAGFYGRPMIDRVSWDLAEAASGTITITNGTNSTVKNKSMIEAMKFLADHGFGSVWIDGRRRLRYGMREYATAYPDFFIHWGRNLISSQIEENRSGVVNYIQGKYGDSLTSASVIQNQESQDQYGLRKYGSDGTIELPGFTTSDEADAFCNRYLADFAFAPLTYKAVLDITGIILEPGDWVRVTDPTQGLDGIRFEVFTMEYNPSDHTVTITCHNTDLTQRNPTGLFIVGVSKIDSGDRIL